MAGHVAVLDVGKTLAKLSLWTRDGVLVDKITRPNRPAAAPYPTLDVDGVRGWLASALSVLGRKGAIEAIVPVGHGAACVVVRDGEIVCPPLDYEAPMPDEARATYDAERDPFEATGSPPLPNGLNLGAQLFRLESLHPRLFDGEARILLWPQYWAWVLSGVMASEVTSLGCHSDLWRPAAAAPSRLAVRRGWAARLPPLRRAGEALGPIRPDWALRTGLARDVRIHCGIHDSNAALIAARGFAELRRKEATVLSTGTWFVAMRTLAPGLRFDIGRLDPARDCLMNVDADGALVPSARFMGGREIELLTGSASRRIDIAEDQDALLAAAPAVIARGTLVLPSMAPGCGPFARSEGRWLEPPEAWRADETRAAAALYAALVADEALDLIGARERILVEGRFAESLVFVRALAALRPRDTVYACNAHNDVSFGALRLLAPDLVPAGTLIPVAPLALDLAAYRAAWKRAIARYGAAA